MSSDASDNGHNVVFVLADALWPYRYTWDEDKDKRWNLDQQAAVNEALDMARRLGWTPK